MEYEESESSSSEPEQEPSISDNEEVEEEESEDEEMDERTALRKQLKDLSFEELEALKQKMGLKEFNEAMFGSQKTKKSPKKPLDKSKKDFRRGNKSKNDAPEEISSKRRVPKLRQVVEVAKSTRRDPRFDKACGEFSDQLWSTDYQFIRDKQKEEAEELKQKLKLETDKKTKREMRKFIQRVSDKEKDLVAKKREWEKKREHIEENRKRVAEGKNPYYMKQSTKKLLELTEKYEELKSTGRLEKYLKKKRKKNAVRDRKSLK